MKHYTETIPFTLAEKLKEKGYNEPCSRYYHTHYDNDEDNAASLESTGDLEPHFLNSLNENRVAAPMYSEVFDWLMEKGFSCEITRFFDFAHEEVCPKWGWSIEKVGPLTDAPGGYANSWHEAANAAIEKALTLI